MSHEFSVIVIGGGATGTGILRDLALRGIKCLLVEQNDLATGTSGRFHGLLHSGARYAVKDANSAKECIEENKILKEIAPGCVEDTGGYFVSTKEDDPSYIDKWLEGCKNAGIKTEEISAKELLKKEPAITPHIHKAYLVPDATVDGFNLAAANVISAKAAGGEARTYTQVTGFKVEDNKVTGLHLKNILTGKEETVNCRWVINAAGPWTGLVSGLAGQNINVSPDKGVLVIFNHRITSKVLNRLRPPGDGDIFVPHGSVTVFGTTSKPADSPDDLEATKEEVLPMLDEGEPLIPEIKEMRLIRAFAGVRPLYRPEGSEGGREASRDFVLLDHEKLTGLRGFVSVVGGKLTTYRLMAKQTADFMAEKLGVDKPCITHKEMLHPPFPKDRPMSFKNICQCERVTEEMLDKAVEERERFSLSDIRRITRLGMGPCQGIFCTFRATGYYQKKKNMSIEETNTLLKEHIQERWKGGRGLLWGWHARETELMRGIYLGLMNLERTGE